jgi:hypothetical protein
VGQFGLDAGVCLGCGQHVPFYKHVAGATVSPDGPPA